MSITRSIYLLLAVIGLVMTWYYNLQFISESGGSFSVSEFMAAGATTSAARSLSWDLAIACITGLIWIYLECKRLGMRFFWVWIILSFGVAFAFAFPLFLFFREGKMEALPAGP